MDLLKMGGDLRFAIKKNRNDQATELIRLIGIETHIEGAGTPLLIACLFNNTDMVAYCLENGSNVNVVNDDLETPLLLACYHDNYVMARMLLEKGAAVNALDKYGKNAILEAISKQSDNYPLIELLLRYGGNPSIKQPTGGSALDFARKLNMEAVLALIETHHDQSHDSKRE